MRILVVEDDAGIAAGLSATLQQRGYAVDVCGRLADAWNALCSEAFSAVLLDLGLPDGDGGELLQRLRAGAERGAALPDPATPVLILTARDQVHQRIAGLDLGADDYLVKPFDVDELEARLRALLRRAAGRAAPTLCHGDLEVDPAARTVRRAGQPVEMSPREFSCCWCCWSRAAGCCRASRSRSGSTTGRPRWRAMPSRSTSTICGASWAMTAS